MDLTLIFSPSGATIVVCLTIILLAILFIVFHRRFRGIIFGYKDVRIEVPREEISTLIEAERDEKFSKIAVEEPKKQETTKEFPIISLFDAVSEQSREGIEKAVEELRKDPPFGFTLRELEIYKWYQLVRAGFHDALNDLKKADQDRPDESYAPEYLARYYLSIRSTENTKLYLEKAEQRARGDKTRADIAILRAALVELEIDKNAAAQSLLATAPTLEDGQQKARIYAEAAKLYRDGKNSILAALNYEIALSLNSEDTSSRFSLALIYAEMPGLKHLAFRHYRVLLQQNHSHAGALNNIALLYETFGVPSKGNALLRQAAEKEDGHAIGNLAATYLAAGFVEDAKRIIADAPANLQKAERVLAVENDIQKADEQAKEKIEKLRSDADKVWLRVHEFPIFKLDDDNNYSGKWKEVGGAATLEIDTTVLISATYKSGQITQYGKTYPLQPITVISVGSDAPKEQSSGLLGLFENRPNQLVLLLGKDKIRSIYFVDNKFVECIDFSKESIG